MKPTNEIEIKRNVYTFSGIILALSILIGSSAWTWSASRISAERRVVVERDSLLVASHEEHVTDSNQIAALNDSLLSLSSRLKNCDASAVSGEMEEIKDWLVEAGRANDGGEVKAYADAMEFTPQASALAQDMARQCRTTLTLLSNRMTQAERALEKASSNPGPGGQQANTKPDCASQIKIIQDGLQEEVTDLKKKLDEAKRDPERIRMAMKQGLQELTKTASFTDGVVLKSPTVQALLAFDEKNTAKLKAVSAQYKHLCKAIGE